MRKKVISILLSALLCLTTVIFAACGPKIDVPDPDDEKVTVTAFDKITTMPQKTAYKEGEIFNISGLVAAVKLSNGKSRKYYATEFRTWTHKDEPLTTDVDKITVTVPETEITFDVPITVAEVPLAVASVKGIKTNPKTTYVEHDVFDISDLVVTVIMTDGTEKDITGAEFTDWTHKNEPLTAAVEYIRALVPGAQDPTLYIEIPVTVDQKLVRVVSATVKTPPATVNYFTGETFDISGIEVEATLDFPAGAKRTYAAADFPAWTYSSKSLEKSDAGAFAVKVPHPNTTGDEVTVTVNITVDDYADLTVTSFKRITELPRVTSYRAGDTFNASGLAVEVVLSNGRLYTIEYDKEPQAFDIPSAALATADETVTVSFNNPTSGTVDFDVPITVAESLQVDTGRLAEYYVNDEVIDFSRLLVVRWIEGGAAQVVAADRYKLFEGTTEFIDKSSVTFATAGAHTLTVRYNNVDVDFDVTIRDKSTTIYPAVIEAENSVFYKADGYGAKKDQPYDKVEYVAASQYFEDNAVKTGPKLPNGASNGTVASLNNLVSGDGSPRYGSLVYFKLTVNVPEDGNYKLKMRATTTASVGETVTNNTFNININGKSNDGGELVYDRLSIPSNRTVKAGNQIASYIDLGKKADGTDVKFDSWVGMFWWSVVDLGDYALTRGENTIRLTMNEVKGINIDYFEVTKSDAAASTQLFSMRDDDRVDLSKNAIYLKQGERITDAVKESATQNKDAYDKLPYKFTLIYLRLPNGEAIPVGEHMLSGLDYDLAGEQTVTVNVTDKFGNPVENGTATFKVFIEAE